MAPSIIIHDCYKETAEVRALLENVIGVHPSLAYVRLSRFTSELALESVISVLLITGDHVRIVKLQKYCLCNLHRACAVWIQINPVNLIVVQHLRK